jgi:hypothetical protein
MVERNRSLKSVNGAKFDYQILVLLAVDNIFIIDRMTQDKLIYHHNACMYLVGFLGVISTGAPGDCMSLGNISTHISTWPYGQGNNIQFVKGYSKLI